MPPASRCFYYCPSHAGGCSLSQGRGKGCKNIMGVIEPSFMRNGVGGACSGIPRHPRFVNSPRYPLHLPPPTPPTPSKAWQGSALALSLRSNLPPLSPARAFAAGSYNNHYVLQLRPLPPFTPRHGSGNSSVCSSPGLFPRFFSCCRRFP